ncbi:MAG: hypothetical protein HRF49_03045 [bacterium]
MRPTKMYRDPISGNEYPVIDREVFVDFRYPYSLGSKRAHDFLEAENLVLRNAYMGDHAGLITVKLPFYISVEYACMYWEIEYSEFIKSVFPIGLLSFDV